METLHLRAESNTMEKILNVINQFSSRGDEIEIVDNSTFDMEQKMILKSLAQEKDGDTFDHDEIWTDLLK